MHAFVVAVVLAGVSFAARSADALATFDDDLQFVYEAVADATPALLSDRTFQSRLGAAFERHQIRSDASSFLSQFDLGRYLSRRPRRWLPASDAELDRVIGQLLDGDTAPEWTLAAVLLWVRSQCAVSSSTASLVAGALGRTLSHPYADAWFPVLRRILVRHPDRCLPPSPVLQLFFHRWMRPGHGCHSADSRSDVDRLWAQLVRTSTVDEVEAVTRAASVVLPPRPWSLVCFEAVAALPTRLPVQISYQRHIVAEAVVRGLRRAHRLIPLLRDGGRAHRLLPLLKDGGRAARLLPWLRDGGRAARDDGLRPFRSAVAVLSPSWLSASDSRRSGRRFGPWLDAFHGEALSAIWCQYPMEAPLALLCAHLTLDETGALFEDVRQAQSGRDPATDPFRDDDWEWLQGVGQLHYGLLDAPDVQPLYLQSSLSSTECFRIAVAIGYWSAPDQPRRRALSNADFLADCVVQLAHRVQRGMGPFARAVYHGQRTLLDVIRRGSVLITDPGLYAKAVAVLAPASVQGPPSAPEIDANPSLPLNDGLVQ